MINKIEQTIFSNAIKNRLVDNDIKHLSIQNQKVFLQHLAKTKHYDEYVYYFKLLENNVKNEHLYHEYLGIAYEALGKYELALKAYEQALLIESKLTSTRISRGFILYRLTKQIDDVELEYIKKLILKRAAVWQHKIRRIVCIYIAKEYFKQALELLDMIENKNVFEFYLDYYCKKQLNQNPTKPDLFRIFIPEKNSDCLSICVNSNPINLNFKSYEFEGDRMDIQDLSVTYYALNFEDIYQKIKEFITANPYKKIVIVSNSKGGLFGAYLFYKIQEEFPNITLIGCILAGLMTINPFVKDLNPITSYAVLYEYINTIKPICDGINYLQKIAFNLQVNQNNKCHFLYGKLSKTDSFQGKFLQSSNTNINVVGFDYSAHSIPIPLSIPPGKDRAYLEQKYATIKLEDDLIGVDGSLLNYVDEIEAIYKSGVTLRDFLT